MLSKVSSSPQFGMCTIKNPEKFIEKEGILAYKKAKIAEQQMQSYRYWHLFADEEGYKVYSKKTKQTYSINNNIRRHAPNSLLIRLLNPTSKIKGKAIGFKVEFKNIDDVRIAYKKIKHAIGLDRAVMIVNALERQARLLELRRIDRKAASVVTRNN